ncbi:glutamine-hydrolyzing GMP synthase [Chloroflexota bacterium]|nr:glutamine-hydrolyzing GMP synthase [Chloroflexota bacterium]
MTETIVILDYGSQYTQLIARRVREAQVYSELLPWDAPETTVMAMAPKGFILSGGPRSVYDVGAPTLPDYVIRSGLPVLGICYGMQLLTLALGGKVAPSGQREYGPATIEVLDESDLLRQDDNPSVWMSHGDRIEQPPVGFTVLAKSGNSPIAAISDTSRGYFGLQFHPEVRHTPAGSAILSRFVHEICGCRGDWTPQSIISQAVERIRAQVGSSRVLAAVSGGVDSSVATALVQKAVGDQLSAVFVDTGLMRKDEGLWVEKAFRENLGANLLTLYAIEDFFDKLEGVTAPEQKRRIIGETFIRLFEQAAHDLGDPHFLVQGTIYPDVVESRAPERANAHRIKTHHNVGGLPEDMQFELVEPLRYLFKDEVRVVGEALGLPRELVWRQPFPGPGLAVRCLGELTIERVEKLRAADAIFTEELNSEGLLHLQDDGEVGTSQAFAVLLPVKAVGVMGDQRTYEEVIALRAVTTEDFMTADWARLPYDVLGRVANRIVNEVRGVNRVVYDITSKPPGTIEWE